LPRSSAITSTRAGTLGLRDGNFRFFEDTGASTDATSRAGTAATAGALVATFFRGVVADFVGFLFLDEGGAEEVCEVKGLSLP